MYTTHFLVHAHAGASKAPIESIDKSGMMRWKPPDGAEHKSTYYVPTPVPSLRVAFVQGRPSANRDTQLASPLAALSCPGTSDVGRGKRQSRELSGQLDGAVLAPPRSISLVSSEGRPTERGTD